MHQTCTQTDNRLSKVRLALCERSAGIEYGAKQTQVGTASPARDTLITVVDISRLQPHHATHTHTHTSSLSLSRFGVSPLLVNFQLFLPEGLYKYTPVYHFARPANTGFPRRVCIHVRARARVCVCV